MSLIIEDGSIVVDAESFISYSDAVASALNLDLVFSDDAQEGRAHLRKAYIWLINMYEEQLQGYRISAIQTGCFPRKGVVARGFEVEEDVIPNDIINAQLFAASAISTGIDINTIKTAGDLKSFTVVDVYSETYKDSSYAPSIALMPQVYNFMKPYTKGGGGINLYREDDFNLGCGGYYKSTTKHRWSEY